MKTIQAWKIPLIRAAQGIAQRLSIKSKALFVIHCDCRGLLAEEKVYQLFTFPSHDLHLRINQLSILEFCVLGTFS